MLRKHTAAALLVLCATASPALAHVGHGPAEGLMHGLLHPISGLDHVLAMVAVGLYAAQLGGRALWLVPSAFVGTMIIGGYLGFAGVPLPMVEQVIGLSVVVMGVMIAFGLRLPEFAAMALVGLFALFHGNAHGSEGMGLASFLSYATGFIIATTLLHLSGIMLGLALERCGEIRSRALRGIAGTAGALFGMIVLVG